MSKFPKIYRGFFNTQSKKQQPNNFPRGQSMSNPDPQQYVCCGGPLLCPAAAWGLKKRNYIPFTMSFAIAFFCYFLSSILLEFSGVSNFPKYTMLLFKKQKPNNFSRGQPMSKPDPQQYVCCLGPLSTIVSSCCPGLKINVITFLLPCPLLQLFLLLSQLHSFGILRGVQLPKIYGAFFKPNEKAAAKQFFKGVVHEQPWSSIVCLLWGSTIVFSCCLRWKIFIHSFYPFLC